MLTSELETIISACEPAIFNFTDVVAQGLAVVIEVLLEVEPQGLPSILLHELDVELKHIFADIGDVALEADALKQLRQIQIQEQSCTFCVRAQRGKVSVATRAGARGNRRDALARCVHAMGPHRCFRRG